MRTTCCVASIVSIGEALPLTHLLRIFRGLTLKGVYSAFVAHETISSLTYKEKSLSQSAILVAWGILIGSGLLRAESTAATYSDGRGVYQGLREHRDTTLQCGGGEIDIVFGQGAPGLDRVRVVEWIRTSAEAVSTYFGRFPVSRVGILVVADDGDRISSGTTYGFGSSAIRIEVGRRTADSSYKDDWILAHEMTHLALPDVPERNRWLLEGNATYVEPIARAQAGQLDPQEVWRWSLEGMPKGLPQAGDQGLDNTPTWGRTYWGGALFWLLADVEIHQVTRNRLGVQDALRAINEQSGGNIARWSIEHILTVGDQATGTRVLTSLYAEMKAAPTNPDLGALFERLGVRRLNNQVAFNDLAPLAEVRRQITMPRALRSVPCGIADDQQS